MLNSAFVPDIFESQGVPLIGDRWDLGSCFPNSILNSGPDRRRVAKWPEARRRMERHGRRARNGTLFRCPIVDLPVTITVTWNAM
jgi:hypothetical protein